MGVVKDCTSVQMNYDCHSPGEQKKMDHPNKQTKTKQGARPEVSESSLPPVFLPLVLIFVELYADELGSCDLGNTRRKRAIWGSGGGGRRGRFSRLGGGLAHFPKVGGEEGNQRQGCSLPTLHPINSQLVIICQWQAGVYLFIIYRERVC